MLRVAHATTRLAAPRSSLSRYPQQQQHALLPATRSYIFLPASFQELHQMIQEAWSSQKEKRRRIWVKLWQRPKEEPPSVQIHTNMPSSSTLRNRRLRRSIATRTRNFKARHKKTFLASKRRLINAQQTLGEQAHDKMTSFRGNMRHSWKSLLLTEPAQADWFDSEGYPKAVRNAFGRFVNPWNSRSTNGIQSLSNFLQWRVQRFYNLRVRPKKQQSPQSTDKLAFSSTPPPRDQIRCTWLGHSTTLVELHGFTVLTDPIFTTTTDPWPFGETRYTPAPCTIHQLPPIDVCVISHDHYDHLDESSVLQLKPNVQYWAVPLGMSKWLQEHCDIPKEDILEMTWWQSISLQRQPDGSLLKVDTNNAKEHADDLTLTCAPAQHWCGRNMVDRNKRLWCSWVVQSKSLKYFFAGDTALPDSFPLHRYVQTHIKCRLHMHYESNMCGWFIHILVKLEIAWVHLTWLPCPLVPIIHRIL